MRLCHSEKFRKPLSNAINYSSFCRDAKVIRDPQTLKSKGYGFVSYPKREEAERAIEQMNGQWLGRRTIRTNWATRKPTDTADFRSGGGGGSVGGGSFGGGGHHVRQSLEEILSQATPDNTSVYIGNIPQNATDEDVRSVFKRFGPVSSLFGFAFIDCWFLGCGYSSFQGARLFVCQVRDQGECCSCNSRNERSRVYGTKHSLLLGKG
jgi:RNA recognition motif-containing protein